MDILYAIVTAPVDYLFRHPVISTVGLIIETAIIVAVVRWNLRKSHG